MNFFGDYHTHTVFSHGKGTIEENIVRAREIGLKEIAITDHGFRHVTYNVRRADFHFMIREVGAARKKYPDMKIFLGLETNLSGLDGDVDIMPEDMESLDILLCGYHKFVWPRHIKEYPRTYFANLVYDGIRYTPPYQVRRNTDAYIKALERYDIDVLTHINYGMRINCLEVAKAAAHYGTYIELNGKHINISDSDLMKMAEAGIQFIVNSDAHSIRKIGDFSRQYAYLKRLDIPHELIANLGKTPVFRSRIKRGLQ